MIFKKLLFIVIFITPKEIIPIKVAVLNKAVFAEVNAILHQYPVKLFPYFFFISYFVVRQDKLKINPL